MKDGARDIAVDDSGNIYIVGIINRTGDVDAFIAKYNETGGQEWIRYWGNNSYDEGNSIVIDDIGNIYIAGNTKISNYYDIFIAKFDNNGISMMNITWSTSENDMANDIKLDDSGNIYIAGYTYGKSPMAIPQALVAKFNSSGINTMNITWGENDDVDYGIALELDEEDNLYLAGISSSYGPSLQAAFIAKFDNIGALQKNITWESLLYNGAYDLVLDDSNNVYLVGFTQPTNTSFYDSFVAKFDNQFIEKWNASWDMDDFDIGYNIAIDEFNNTYITGVTSSSQYTFDSTGFITKYNGSGVEQWNINCSFNSGSTGNAITLDQSRNIYLTGNFYNIPEEGDDIFIEKYFSDTLAPTWDQEPTDQPVESGYPFYYNVNASDPSGISTYLVNDTINFEIDSNGIITNSRALSRGKY